MRSIDRRTLSIALIVSLLALAACAGTSPTDRQAEVAQRGSQVMPFDLSKSMHTFTKTDDGGREAVTANDPSDQSQIALIRQHLAEEQAKFSRGDFGDPAQIHGMDMPGISQLSADYRQVTVTYQDTPTGGELRYQSADPAIVSALHDWFDRQVMDHGSSAQAG